jgi:hypothetical protein
MEKGTRKLGLRGRRHDDMDALTIDEVPRIVGASPCGCPGTGMIHVKRFVAECGVKNVHMALGDRHFPNLVCRILCKPESSRSFMDDAIGVSIWRRQRKLSNCPCACYTSDVVPIIFCEHQRSIATIYDFQWIAASCWERELCDHPSSSDATNLVR